MQSSYNTGWKMFKTALTGLAFIVTSLVALRQSANALTISVGTQSVVNLPLNVAPDVWVAGNSGNGFTVIYTTRDAVSYSIMFASQTGIAGVSGGAPGWTLSTIYSTTTNAASNTNIAKILAGQVIPGGNSNNVVVYYYDDAMKNLMYISAPVSSLPAVPVGIATATIKGIDLRADSIGSTVLFSSLTANGNYALVIASGAWSAASSPIGVTGGYSSILLSTGSAQNVDMTFRISQAKDAGQSTKVYFYDTLSQTLEELFLDSGNNPIPTTRGTIDTGMFVNSSIAPFNALAPVNEGSNNIYTTALLYTDASNGVKVAVQRRNITNQAWYIQVVDAGVAQNLGSATAGTAYRVDYVKNAGTASSSLWEARPAGGTYFDDFSESIVNTQQGKAKILSAVNGYAQTSNVTPADKGLFLLSDNTLGAYNYITLAGNVYDSWGNGALGTGANGLTGVSIEANVKNSTVSFGGATVDQNPGAVDANGTTMTQGGVTTSANGAGGAYQINVSSGAGIVVTPSSTSWVFYQASSQSAVIISTASWAAASGAMGGLNFIAVSSPVIFGATLSISSGTQFSTASVMFMGSLNGNGTGTGNETWFLITRSSAGQPGGIQSDGWSKSEYARFVGLSAANVAISTLAYGDNALYTSQDIGSIPAATVSNTGANGGTALTSQANVIPPMVLGANTAGGTASNGWGPQSPTIYTATGSVWSRFASTDMPTGGISYTLVVSTKIPTGAVMQGTLSSALLLVPLNISTVSAVVSATDISTPMVNTSLLTTFVIKSTFTNMYPPSKVWQTGNIVLTTSPVINDAAMTGATGATGVSYSSDVALAATAVDYSNGNYDTIVVSTGLLGLNYTGFWYVRISSRPVRSDGVILPQTAISGPITILGPSITGVFDVNGSSLANILVANSTTSLQALSSTTFLLSGKGFIAGTWTLGGGLTAGNPVGQVFLSTYSITTNPTITPGVDSSYNLVATTMTSYTSVTGTSALVTVTFKPFVEFGAVAGTTKFNIFYSTSVTGGVTPTGTGMPAPGLLGSTITTMGTSLMTLTASSSAVTYISPSTVTYAGVYTLTLNGYGLPAGATVSFIASDGSSSMTPVAVNEMPGSAGGPPAGLSDFRQQLTVNVDFRSTTFAGKTFYVQLSSISNTGGSATIGSTVVWNVNSLPLVFCTTPTVSLNAPFIAGMSPNTIFNSTGTVSIGLSGMGLTPGSTVSLYAGTLNDTPQLISSMTVIGPDSGGGDAGSGVRGTPTKPFVLTSSGVFGSFISTGITNLSAGAYTIRIATTIPPSTMAFPGANFGSAFQLAYTATFSVSAAAISAATLISHPAAYTTLQFATYSVTGTGLMPNVSWYLSLAANGVNSNIGATSVTTVTANGTNVNVTFDLRAATTTGSFTLVAWSTSSNLNVPNTVGLSGSTWTSSVPGLSVTNAPVLGVIPNQVFTNMPGAFSSTIPITGQGLVLGATVAMSYSGTTLASLGTTDYISSNLADTSLRIGTITAVCGAGYSINGVALNANSAPPCAPGTPSQSTGVVVISMDNAFPSTSWNLQMQAFIPAGSYGMPAPQGGPVNGRNGIGIQANVGGANTYKSNLSTFTVIASSAPNAPTGLTVLSAGVNTVTLQWVTPGAEGNVLNLTSGANFIVYYSSGQNLGTNSVNGITRGYGCAPCYPVGAITNPNNGALINGSTNFTFANTWAQFLTYDKANADSAVSTITNVNATYASNLNSSRGISVATMTIPIASLTIVASTQTGISTGSITNSGTIQPGTVVQATLSNLNGANPLNSGYFWFVVRTQNQFGNLSPTNIVYSTVSALVLASPSNTTSTPINNLVTSSFTNTLPDGTVVTAIIPAGATAPGDRLNQTAETNSIPATPGVAFVGTSDIDYSLASGNQPLVPVNLVFTVNITLVTNALTNAGLAANAYNLVKVAFYNGTRWVIVPDSSFNGASVSAIVTHFTKFAVVVAKAPSNLSGAAVYPNPWRPTLASHYAQKITFDTLPAGSTIKVFTVAGQLVKSLVDDQSTGSIKWNGQNDGGQDLASGVYFCLIQGGGDTKTIKVAIQR